MPFVSQQQRRWAYTKEGTKALGGKKAVQEWQRASVHCMVYNRWLKKYESLCKERRGTRKSQGKKQGDKCH